VDDLAANWFVNRKGGTFTTGVATIHAGVNVGEAVTIPIVTEFMYSPAASFVVDSTVPVVVSRDVMVKEFDSAGTLSGYKFHAPLIAQVSGSVGNIPAGKFEAFDAFDPNIVFVEAETEFSTATDIESNEELIARAKVAVTARDLVSVRALDTTLKDEVTDVQEVTVIGAGDAEMERDKVVEITKNVSVHVLGHVNVYSKLPQVPGLAYPSGGGATAALAATATTIQLSALAAYQFPWSRITKVTLDNAGVVTTLKRRSSFVDPADPAKFKVLIGDAAAYVSENDDNLAVDQFKVTRADNLDAGSDKDIVTFTFLADADDARTMAMEYSGVKSLAAVSSLLADRDRRVVAANMRAYAHLPAVATIAVGYYADPDAPGAFPTTDAKAKLADFVNNFPLGHVLRVSDIVKSFLDDQAAYVNGVSFPVSVDYRLDAPDGNVVLYRSTDKLTVENIALQVETGSYTEVQRVAQQVSDRTVRVVTAEDLITFTLTA
jgi:hypothetical protein